MNKQKRTYFSFGEIPYYRDSPFRVLTGYEQLDYLIKGLEVGITLVVGNTNCVDADTEFFNGKEWKRIADYSFGDKVLQYNEDGTAELVFPELYHKTPCETLTLMRNGKGSINQCLSDNHSFVYKNKHTHKVEKVPFVQVKNDIRSVMFKGEVITAFDYKNKTETETIDEWLLRLFIAISADGHFPKKTANTYCRMNLKHNYKKERLEFLLEKCGIEYKKTQINPKDLAFDTYVFHPPEKIKEFPESWYGLSKREFEIIYDEVFRWDGDNKHATLQYRTTLKKNADFIQFVCSSLGKRARIKADNRVGSKMSNGYTRKSICYTVYCGCSDCYVAMNTGKPISFSEYKAKDGFMYCFTVPSGMLVLRREGSINITGNCGKSSFIQTLISQCIKQKQKLFYFAGEHTARTFKNQIYHQNSAPKDYRPVDYVDANGNATVIQDWYVTEKREKELRQLFDENIYFYGNKAPRDIDSILEGMLDCHKETGCKVYFIDNLISIDNISSNTFSEQTAITEKIRQFALNTGSIVVLVAHQRKTEKKTFRLDISDVAGSQNISNKAYNVLALYRKDMIRNSYTDASDFAVHTLNNGFDFDNCDGFIEVLKTKGNGNGIVGLKYDTETRTFSQAPKLMSGKAEEIKAKMQKEIDHQKRKQRLALEDLPLVDDDEIPF